MDNTLRAQIRLNQSIKETDELIEIWQNHDLNEWSELTFDAIKEILIERQVVLPPQVKSNEQESNIDAEMKVNLVYWLARFGWGFGMLDCLIAVLLLLSMVILSGFNRLIVSLLWLLLPIGLVGLILSLISFFQIPEEYPKERKRAKQGIKFSFIGALLGSLWFLVADVVLRF